MKFTVPLPMLPASHFVPMAKAAEAHGFDSVAVSDSVFYPQTVSADYPFSDDGSRYWPPDTPFLDPIVAISAMAAVTERIGFLTNVLKVPLRDPLLLTKQVASLAALSGDRFRLGVGVSWIPEEFEWTGTDMRTRGARTDEIVDILRKVATGDRPTWAEHDGPHYRFGRLMMSPAGRAPLRILAGGHSDAAMRRACRNDGWISANVMEVQLTELLDRLRVHLDKAERDPSGFEINVLAMDVFDADGFARLEAMGVTDCQVCPWYYYGGDPTALSVQLDSLARFADEIIRPGQA